MDAAQHTPDQHGDAGLEISLRIGQHVRHREDFRGKRVTGVVRGISVDSEDVLYADVALDEALVFPPINADDHELRIYRQHVPAHELVPFDEREEVLAELLAFAGYVVGECEGQHADPEAVLRAMAGQARAAIAKHSGAAA